MFYYEYSKNAKCACGYLWTTPGNYDIVCACGETKIEQGCIIGNALPTDEEEFKIAVATELQLDIDDLTIIQV